jgi:two-component SAPR family response regulator
MPYLNGCELGTKVKELNGNIKVILISSYNSVEDNNNKLNFEFHRKPVTLQKLLDIVYVSLNNNGKISLSGGLDEI